MQVRIAHNGIVVEVGEDREAEDRIIVKVTEAAEGPEGSLTVNRVSIPARSVGALMRALEDMLELAAESVEE